MGWLKNVGKALGKAATDTAHAVGNAQNNKWVKGAEALGLGLTGVGIPEAALLMGGAGAVGGTLRSGGGLKGALTEGGQGALTGGLASGAGSGIRAIASKFGAGSGAGAAGQMVNKVTGAGPTDVASDAGGLSGAISNLPQNDPGFLSQAGGFIKNHANDIAGVGKAAEGIYNDYRDIQNYNIKKPLRTRAANLMYDPGIPDASNLLAPVPSNYRAITVGSRG